MILECRVILNEVKNLDTKNGCFSDFFTMLRMTH